MYPCSQVGRHRSLLIFCSMNKHGGARSMVPSGLLIFSPDTDWRAGAAVRTPKSLGNSWEQDLIGQLGHLWKNRYRKRWCVPVWDFQGWKWLMMQEGAYLTQWAWVGSWPGPGAHHKWTFSKARVERHKEAWGCLETSRWETYWLSFCYTNYQWSLVLLFWSYLIYLLSSSELWFFFKELQ